MEVICDHFSVRSIVGFLAGVRQVYMNPRGCYMGKVQGYNDLGQDKMSIKVMYKILHHAPDIKNKVQC
jgi:hypothetical protein